MLVLLHTDTMDGYLLIDFLFQPQLEIEIDLFVLSTAIGMRHATRKRCVTTPPMGYSLGIWMDAVYLLPNSFSLCLTTTS